MRRVLGIALALFALPSCGSLFVFVPAPGEMRFTVVNGTDVDLLVTPLHLSDGLWYTLPLIRKFYVQIPYGRCADFELSAGEAREFAYYASELFPDSLFVVLPDSNSRMQELTRDRDSGFRRNIHVIASGSLEEAPAAAIRAVESERRAFGRVIFPIGLLLLGPLWFLGFITWLFLPRKPRSPSPDPATPLR